MSTRNGAFVHGTGDWKVVDGALRAHAHDRAERDADELVWIREADAVQLWRRLGMVSLVDYLERIGGYGPQVARERIRVARALAVLPALSASLADGELSYSAVREVTRIATPETDEAWRDHARGKNLRQLEDAVTRREVGDGPDDPGAGKVRRCVVRFELDPEVFARLRQVQAALAEQRGGRLDADQLVTAFCDAVMEPRSEERTRGKFQIAVKTCPGCDAATQEGGGLEVPISAAAVERARCDAQHIGSLDGDGPERATQDVPPAMMRFVWRRAGGKCQTEGCRSAVGLEVHHLVHRADGGGHDPENLRLLCSACHLGLHRGDLQLAPRRDGLAAKRPATAHVAREACDALVALGWTRAIARAAVETAMLHVGDAVASEVLVRAAIRECPRPRA
jgi:hypothetical protein